jgi:hypothetical protein
MGRYAEMVLMERIKEIHAFPPKDCFYEEERMCRAMVDRVAFSSTTLHNKRYGIRHIAMHQFYMK